MMAINIAYCTDETGPNVFGGSSPSTSTTSFNIVLAPDIAGVTFTNFEIIAEGTLDLGNSLSNLQVYDNNTSTYYINVAAPVSATQYSANVTSDISGHTLACQVTANATGTPSGASNSQALLDVWVICSLNIVCHLAIAISGIYTGSTVQAVQSIGGPVNNPLAGFTSITFKDNTNASIGTFFSTTTPSHISYTYSASLTSSQDMMDDDIEMDFNGIVGRQMTPSAGEAIIQTLSLTCEVVLNAPTIPT
ncbi:MAG: hypothetical protein ACYCQJ_05225 [Nitrososphaerales archaeon]